MQDDLQSVPRFPWGDFPDVLRNGNLGELKQQPEYAVAKAGSDQAALDLVDRVLRPEFINSVRHLGSMHERPVLLPVLAAETSGSNKIPLMLAHAVAHRLDWPVEERVVQITRAWHTDSGADHRLVVHPEFAGPVNSDVGYILIDDTLTMGGTVADLRGFIMSRGGHVLGASVAVAHEGALHLPLRDQMRDDIFARHGKDAAQEFAYEEFGYGIECLTQGEAGHIRKAVSLDALRDRFAAARDAHSRRLGESRAIPPVSEQRDANFIGFRSTDELRNRGVKARRERDARILSKAVSRDERSAEEPLTHRNFHPPPEALNQYDSLVEAISRGGHMAAQLDHLLSYGPLDVVGSNDAQNPGLHIVNMDAENRAFIPQDDPLHREIRRIIEKNPHSMGFAANQIHARLEQEGRWDGPERDAEGLSFSPSINPEPEKAVETEKKVERAPEKAQEPSKKPDLAAQDVESREIQTVSLKMEGGQDLPEHYAAEVKMIPLVLDEGTTYPAHTRPDLPIAEYAVQRGLRDTRFDEFGKTLGNGHYREVTQTRAKTLEEAQKRMAEYAQQPVQPQELNALKQLNAQNVEIYEARQAEQREAPEQARQESAKAPEPEQAKEPTKTPENAPEKDPLGLGDVKKPTEHLFPEQQDEKGPEKEPEKPKFERKNPPEVLFANPKGKPYVLDHGDKVSVTNRAMLGLGHEAAEKRRKAVEIGLKAAVDRFGEPVRFQGNRAFLEETVKVAMERGIKLEPASPMAKEIYERAVKEHGNQFGPSKAAPYRAPEKKQEMDKGKGIGL